jgi:predicted MPP superfamily phosphohydrolase
MLQKRRISFIKFKVKDLFDMNKWYIEEIENSCEQIKEHFKILADDELCDAWADTFEVENIDKKCVTISYNGDYSIKRFKKECKDLLLACVRTILGKKKKIKICKGKQYKSFNPKIKTNIRAAKFFVIGMIFVCFATAAVVILCSYISNRNFRESFYSVSSIKVDSQIRVVHISDLHGCSYGENNTGLFTRVEELKPDIIICSGDIVNSAKDEVDFAVNLGQKLSKIAPSYYVYGNNEVESIYGFPLNEKELDKKLGFESDNRDETKLLEIKDDFEKRLEKTGMKVLKNQKDTIKVNTMTVDVFGILTSNPSSFWSYTEKSFADYLYENPENIKITAVHEPFIFEEFQPEFWGDLMVCGHTHGGLMRVPLLGPLYTHEGGLFPERNGKFVYGRYDAAGTPLIVSSGLENSNILRINNTPELVVIDINKF